MNATTPLRRAALLGLSASLPSCAAGEVDGDPEPSGPASGRLVIDFTRADEAARWRVVDDVVMGGVSSSRVVTTADGTTAFTGTVSLENDGGFAGARTDGDRCALDGATAVLLRVRGDGKDYRLRLRDDVVYDMPSRQATFSTVAGEWIDVELPLADFELKWRGRPAEGPPLDPAAVRSIGLVIADEQEGPFRLELAALRAR